MQHFVKAAQGSRGGGPIINAAFTGDARAKYKIQDNAAPGLVMGLLARESWEKVYDASRGEEWLQKFEEWWKKAEPVLGKCKDD